MRYLIRPSKTAFGAILVAAMFGATPLVGQSITRASASIQVTDEVGIPILGANLILTETASGISREFIVPRDGSANFVSLSPGRYSVRAEQIGYVPQVITGIELRAGGNTRIPIALVASATVAARVDTVALSGGWMAGISPGRATEISVSDLEHYPLATRRLNDLFAFSSAAGDGFEVEGLPGVLTGIRVDGIQVGALDSYALVPGGHRSAALPLSMFGHASLVTGNPDVEWSGHAGGSLELFSAPSRNEAGFDTYGRWSGGGLRQAGASGVQPTDQLVEAGVLWAGPVVPDSAHVSVGLEMIRRLEEPLVSRDVLSADVGQVVRDVYGLSPVEDRSVSLISGFGTVAWELSPTTRFDGRTNFGLVPTSGSEISPDAAGQTRTHKGLDINLSGALTTRFSDRLYQEARIGLEKASRTFDETDPFGQVGPTRISAGGDLLGPVASGLQEYGRWVVRMSETVHFNDGAHRLKAGVSGTLGGVDVVRSREIGTWIADASRFAAGTGYVVSSSPNAPAANFSTVAGAFFAQDVWNVATGFDLLVGARFEIEGIPGVEARLNEDWTSASGLIPVAPPKLWWRVSPRLGFTWDVGNRHDFLVAGSAGVYSGNADPVMLADWNTGAEGAEIRRGFGSIAGWPDPSGGSALGVATPALTMVNPGFEGARTARADLGIGRALGSNTMVRISGAFRRTDFLPRVFDLNLNGNPKEVDQYGRPVFGTLESRTGLLFPVTGSNRRFGAFDRVLAIEVDGLSTYRGVTAGIVHRLGDGSEFFASYTLSNTVDNLFGGGGYAAELALDPRVPDSGGDWVSSTSDLDVPNRAVVGADLNMPVLDGSRLAILYRFQSGAPFTPGFGSGVDANGDGSFGNDPAYIDGNVPGAAAMISQWSCLAADQGGFATRNGCRTDATHSLDARLAIGVLNAGRYRGELLVEALNLFGSYRSAIDTALYLVDPNAQVVRDSSGGVDVPLVVNENFGQPIKSLSPGRIFRVGFRMEL